MMLGLALAWLLLNPAAPAAEPVDPWTDESICADGVSCEQLDPMDDLDASDVCSWGDQPCTDEAYGADSAQQL